MPPASVWALVDEPEEETAIPAISIEGENGSCRFHRFHRFQREDLETFKAVFTTVLRIAEQAGRRLKLDEIGLNSAGVKPVFRKRDLGIQLYRIADLPAAFHTPVVITACKECGQRIADRHGAAKVVCTGVR